MNTTLNIKKAMKSVVKAFLPVCLVGSLSLSSCTDYQDEINALDYRITVLEELVDIINNNIKAVEIAVNALETRDYITNVNETEDGYLINFHLAGPIEIKNGKDGEDAQVPEIDVVKDDDGNYYWVVNGEYVTDDGTPSGNKIRVNGKDGKDGKDAVSPQVRINPETSEWEVSTDGGEKWNPTGTPSKGKDGKDGKDGQDGKDGNVFIKLVTYEGQSGNEYMVITTVGGTIFRIPIYRE